MKKYSVRLASLVLFSAIFAPGMAIGETDLPSLPSDVKKIIANKTLRLILDEAEDNPGILMEPQISLSRSIKDIFASYSFLFGLFTDTTPLIDSIIFLIESGADPNTKSYKGNTVLHLLMNEPNFASMVVKGKLGYLIKLKLNLNEKNADGETAASMLMKLVLYERRSQLWDFIFWLKDLGLDFTTIKVKPRGFEREATACEIGQRFIKKYNRGSYDIEMLNKLCLPK